jgi:glycerophosphoryl diester phosphodiesterase
MKSLLPLSLALASLFAMPYSSADDPIRQRIFVTAHRGAHQDAPENSLAAIRAAIDLGCDYVELDVRKTKDGKLVLMHDSTVDRTTDGKGKVDQLTFDEIRALKFDGKTAEKHPDEVVPTFDEALAICREKIGLYLDHKAGDVPELLEAVKRHDMLAKTIVYSSHEKLREFKKLEPKIRIMPDHADDIAKLAEDLHPETMDGGVHRWTRELVETAHKHKVEVWVDILGPLDNEAGYKYGLDIGVDAIQTDHPAELLEFLKKQNRR